MTLFCIPALLLLAGLTISAQAQPSASSSLFRHIPPDADHVYGINSPVLTSKIGWSELFDQLPGFYKTGPGGMTEFRQSLLESGIDAGQEFMIATSNTNIPDSFTYTTLIAHLTDSGKFIRLLHEKIKPLRRQPIPGYHAEGSMFYCVAFTDKLAIFVEQHPPRHETPHRIESIQYQLLGARRAVAGLRGYDHSYFNTDPAFRAEFTNEADLHLWFRKSSNFEVLNSLYRHLVDKTRDITTLTGIVGDHFSPTFGSLRFDAGRLSLVTKQALAPRDSLTRRVAAAPFDERLMKFIPADKEFLAIRSLHLDGPDLQTKANQQGRLDSLVGSIGLRSTDIFQATGGDFLFLSIKPEQLALDSSGYPMAGHLAFTTIKDQPSFDKLKKRLEDSGLSVITYQDIAVIGTDEQQEVQLLGRYSENADSTARLATPRLANSPFTFAVDFRQMSDYYARFPTADHPVAKMARARAAQLSNFDRLFFAAGAVRDNMLETFYEIRMTDQQENALLTLLRLLKTASTSPY